MPPKQEDMTKWIPLLPDHLTEMRYSVAQPYPIERSQDKEDKEEKEGKEGKMEAKDTKDTKDTNDINENKESEDCQIVRPDLAESKTEPKSQSGAIYDIYVISLQVVVLSF